MYSKSEKLRAAVVLILPQFFPENCSAEWGLKKDTSLCLVFLFLTIVNI